MYHLVKIKNTIIISRSQKLTPQCKQTYICSLYSFRLKMTKKLIGFVLKNNDRKSITNSSINNIRKCGRKKLTKRRETYKNGL